jgi:hypothetical protein
LAANYLALIAEVQDYLHRADASTARVDGWIDQVESYLSNNLRTNEMETANGSFTVTNGVITNPSDFLGWKNITLTSNATRYQLKPTNHEQKQFIDPDGSTGIPTHYYVRAGSTILVPTPDSGTYTVAGTYFQRIPGLSSSVTTNWVINNYPETYLYGCLVMAMGFYGDDPRLPTWKSYWDVSVNGIKQTQTERNFGQVGVMRTEYPVY